MYRQQFLPPALWLSVFMLASGCGGSSTEIIEREPVADPAEEGQDHDHEEEQEHEEEHGHGEAPETKGRLVIAAHDESEVVVYELDDGTELAHYELGSEATAVHASAANRLALLIQRDGDQVNALDSGLMREQHDGHWDYTVSAPAFMDFEAPGPRPTHYTRGDNRSVIFYDGNADTGEVARVGVFTEADLADNGAGRWLELDTHQHGAARFFDGQLFVTLRDPANTDTTLPDRVARYHWHDGAYEQEQVFDEICPELHGSARWSHGVAFGCSDGVLVVHAENGAFAAEKIANPEGLEGRIGSLYASPSSGPLVGVASGNLYAIDPETDSIEPVDWRGGEERSAEAYGFDAAGEHFLVLDAGGDLTRLEVADDWHRKTPIEVVTSDLTGLDEGLGMSMSPSAAGHWVYVTDPVNNTVLEVDLESGEVHTAATLDVTPSKLVWLGFAGAGPAHDHDEEHEH